MQAGHLREDLRDIARDFMVTMGVMVLGFLWKIKEG